MAVRLYVGQALLPVMNYLRNDFPISTLKGKWDLEILWFSVHYFIRHHHSRTIVISCLVFKMSG